MQVEKNIGLWRCLDVNIVLWRLTRGEYGAMEIKLRQIWGFGAKVGGIMRLWRHLKKIKRLWRLEENLGLWKLSREKFGAIKG